MLLQFSRLKPSVFMSLSVNNRSFLEDGIQKKNNPETNIQRYVHLDTTLFKTFLSSLAEISICCKI